MRYVLYVHNIGGSEPIADLTKVIFGFYETDTSNIQPMIMYIAYDSLDPETSDWTLNEVGLRPWIDEYIVSRDRFTLVKELTEAELFSELL